MIGDITPVYDLISKYWNVLRIKGKLGRPSEKIKWFQKIDVSIRYVFRE
jgi:hypothetical protein